MLTENTVNVFLDELASAMPAPGGGSAAALSGSVGAALVSMVCNLTLGKKKYAEVEPQVRQILAQSEGLRKHLLELIEEDVQAYNAVSASFKLPRETDAEKAHRQAEMQRTLKAAVMPPMKIVEACVAVLKLCQPIAELGNVNAISDAGVGAVAAEAGMRGGRMNVLINLGQITDAAFVAEQSAKLNALIAGVSDQKEQVVAYVESKL